MKYLSGLFVMLAAVSAEGKTPMTTKVVANNVQFSSQLQQIRGGWFSKETSSVEKHHLNQDEDYKNPDGIFFTQAAQRQHERHVRIYNKYKRIVQERSLQKQIQRHKKQLSKAQSKTNAALAHVTKAHDGLQQKLELLQNKPRVRQAVLHKATTAYNRAKVELEQAQEVAKKRTATIEKEFKDLNKKQQELDKTRLPDPAFFPKK